MAWQRPSRSSFSRRERNRALFAVIGASMVILVGLVLLVMSRADPTRGAMLRGATLDATAPVWRAARAPFEWAGAGVRWVDDYFIAISRNRALEAELKRARLVQQRHDRLQRENAQLKALLRVRDPGVRWSRVFAISGSNAASYVRSAVISGGRADGIAPGQPVRSAAGLVGRVVETGRHAARVLLLTDTNSRVPVRVLRTGKPAMIAGANSPLLEVRYVAEADGPLRVGDRLVTSGDGGIFPPDVPVATVVGVRGETPLARPIARPEGLGYVSVEAPYLPPLPPAPAPAASAKPVP